MKINRFSIDYQMKRFNLSEKEAKKKIENIRNGCKSGNVYSLDWQVKKYKISEEEAKIKIEGIKEKIRISHSNMSDFDRKSMTANNPEHWIKKGHNETEAKEKARLHINHMQSVYQKKKKENPEKYKSSFNTNIKYWINKGYSIKEAKKKLKDRQNTNNLKTYIKKYGDAGYEKWKIRNKEWSIIMEQKYRNNEYNRSPKDESCFSSNIEKEFIDLLSKEIDNIETQFKIYKKEGGFFLYDALVNNKIIIEFNGDFWHANPNIYDKNWVHPILKESASSIWKYGDEKINRAKELGYKILIVWEADFNKDKEGTLHNVLKFLNL